MNRTQANVSLLMVGQTTRQPRFFRGVYYRAESKTEFQHSGIWSLCLKGLISSFSGVLTMRLCLTVQLRQPCLSGPRVQPVLCNRVKSTTEDWVGTHGCLANEIKHKNKLKPIFVNLSIALCAIRLNQIYNRVPKLFSCYLEASAV